MEIKGNNADVLWSKIFRSLLSSRENTVESRAGETVEQGQVLLKLTDPSQKWVTQREPAISIGFALAEIVWILNGSNDARLINYWNPALAKYTGQESRYHGAYGYRLERQFGIDQLSKAYQILKNNPISRQVVLCYYDPKEDLPALDGSPRSPDIPCNVVSIIKIRDNKLNWTQVLRSNDVIRGLPYNFVQFTSLQELLAGWLGIEPGCYSHFSDSLHLYESDLPLFSKTISINQPNTDHLYMEKKQSDFWFSRMFSIMMKTAYSDQGVSEEMLKNSFCLESGIEALDNMMFIIGAYTSRKNHFSNVEKYLINRCTNQLYKKLWERWENRTPFTQSRGV